MFNYFQFNQSRAVCESCLHYLIEPRTETASELQELGKEREEVSEIIVSCCTDHTQRKLIQLLLRGSVGWINFGV